MLDLDATTVDTALLNTLLTNAPVGFAFFDRELRYQRVNNALVDINGLPAEAHIGRTVVEVLPNQSPEVLESLRRVLVTGEPLVNVEVTGETPAAPGKQRDWLVSYYPVRDKQGETLGLGAIVSEITERKRSEEALRESQMQTRTFLRDVLYSVSEGRLRLCDAPADLPPPLARAGHLLRLSAESLRALRQHSVDVAIAHGLSTERWQDLVTAVGEASMNAVVHGGGGEALVCAGGSTVQVWIQDQGKGIAMDRLHRATLERGYTTTGTMGHGFWMMLKTCDRVWLLTGTGGTTVVLEQDRTPPDPPWLRAR